MNISDELIEIVAAIVPAILALLFAFKQPKQVAGWVVWVLGSSFVTVVALGLLLKRLTVSCNGTIPSCEPPMTLFHRVPGIFNTCVRCGTDPISSTAIALNQASLPLQAGVAIVCLIISSITTLRFVLWARRVLTDSTSNTP